MSNISVPKWLECGKVERSRFLDIRDIKRQVRDGHVAIRRIG